VDDEEELDQLLHGDDPEDSTPDPQSAE
jgi:hypothetical protein